MYIGTVAKTKQMLEEILNDNENISTEYMLDAISWALSTIKVLEYESNQNYSEGKAEGMERMAMILMGQTEKE